jgi:hypothetical protein
MTVSLSFFLFAKPIEDSVVALVPDDWLDLLAEVRQAQQRGEMGPKMTQARWPSTWTPALGLSIASSTFWQHRDD